MIIVPFLIAEKMLADVAQALRPGLGLLRPGEILPPVLTTVMAYLVLTHRTKGPARYM